MPKTVAVTANMMDDVVGAVITPACNDIGEALLQ